MKVSGVVEGKEFTITNLKPLIPLTFKLQTTTLCPSTTTSLPPLPHRPPKPLITSPSPCTLAVTYDAQKWNLNGLFADCKESPC